MKKDQKLADLIQGIEGLLSKNRCPLTCEEEVLLKSCLAELNVLKNKNSTDLLASMEKVITWLLLLFGAYDRFKNIF